MKHVVFACIVAALFLSFPSDSGAYSIQDPVTVAAQVCNAGGACAPVDPATALLIMGLAQIAQELSKDDPFGENNEIVKAVRNIVSDIANGAGPNNELLKIFNNMGSDLKCGPGPNNDVVKFLGSLGVKIETRKCN